MTGNVSLQSPGKRMAPLRRGLFLGARQRTTLLSLRRPNMPVHPLPLDRWLERCSRRRGTCYWLCLMLTRLKSLFPKKTSRCADESGTYKKQGDEHLKRDRLDDAAGCYRRAVSINPDYVDACVGLGFVLSEQKQYREAEQYLRHALSIEPGNADAHYTLGTISKNQNDQVASIEHFTRALEVKPDFEFAYRDLFAALFQGGQIQKAKEVLGRAISVYPASAEFQFYLGNLLTHEEDFDAAVACYQKALSLQPGSAESHKNLADVLEKARGSRPSRRELSKSSVVRAELCRCARRTRQRLAESGQVRGGHCLLRARGHAAGPNIPPRRSASATSCRARAGLTRPLHATGAQSRSSRNSRLRINIWEMPWWNEVRRRKPLPATRKS